ncbi:LAMI_0D12904g1_1 [Lachancea mirantina]|uniref:LAMI_0D12904g1_1 n=1 Tax=Lachancea mirantina TaxID=1230905 RepID=A0A1G4JG25_9SACH|nr:LAMI_0D12904g1_1 [Lachancea mirantina]
MNNLVFNSQPNNDHHASSFNDSISERERHHSLSSTATSNSTLNDEPWTENVQNTTTQASNLVEELSKRSCIPRLRVSESCVSNLGDGGSSGSEEVENVSKDKDLTLTAEVIDCLSVLSRLLLKSQEENRQLKFRNLMLTSGLKDSNSRLEVETNINKQQYERLKCQILMEGHELQRGIRARDLKVSKYKETIIAKNKKINKLMRLLKERTATESKNSSATPSILNSHSDKADKVQNDSNMLTTLGLLASHVLNEDPAPRQKGIDITDSDISHDSFLSHDSSRTASEKKPMSLSLSIDSRAGGVSSSQPNPSPESIRLPRFQSFQQG